MTEEYELIIIGGGPAGLTAGIYASRARLRTLLIESAVTGGQITSSEWVENFPGFPSGISGFDLGQLFYEQATRYGLEVLAAETEGAELSGKRKVVHTSEGDRAAGAVILAMGAQHSKLEVAGEERLLGKGVSFCATCDGAFFQGQRVAVVGGGNAAVGEALFLSKMASRVFLIHRRDQLRADRILQERVLADPNIEMVWDSVVEGVSGADRVEGLALLNVKTGRKTQLVLSGVFVAVGFKPNTSVLGGAVPLDDAGCIMVNDRMETALPGVYAAGDIRHNSSRQVVTAAGDGATAAISAEKFLRGG